MTPLPQTWNVIAGDFGISALDPTKPQVAVIAKNVHAIGSDFIGDMSVAEDRAILLGPCAEGNATTLRQRLPWLRPQPLGLNLSAGFGDGSDPALFLCTRSR